MPVFICFQSKYVQLLARQKAAAQRRRDARSKLMKRYGCYMPCWYCSICHVAHRSNCTTTCSDHCGGGGSYEPPFFIYVCFWGVLLTCVLLTLPLSSLTITAHHCRQCASLSKVRERRSTNERHRASVRAGETKGRRQRRAPAFDGPDRNDHHACRQPRGQRGPDQTKGRARNGESFCCLPYL